MVDYNSYADHDWEVPSNLTLPPDFDNNKTTWIARQGKRKLKQKSYDTRANISEGERRFRDFCTVKKNELRPFPPNLHRVLRSNKRSF